MFSTTYAGSAKPLFVKCRGSVCNGEARHNVVGRSATYNARRNKNIKVVVNMKALTFFVQEYDSIGIAPDVLPRILAVFTVVHHGPTSDPTVINASVNLRFMRRFRGNDLEALASRHGVALSHNH